MYTEAELAARKAARAVARAEEKRQRELRMLTAAARYDEFTMWWLWKQIPHHPNWSQLSHMVLGWWKAGLTVRLAKDGTWLLYRPEFSTPWVRAMWNHEAVYRWADDV